MTGDLLTSLPNENPLLWALLLMVCVDVIALALYFLWEFTLKRMGAGDHEGGSH